jgi:pimeloyl-ACP methyl ester carboxylesterase
MVAPYATCHVSHDGQPRLAVRTTGDSPRVLLVHGATCTADVWTSVLIALADLGTHAAALDLRGHGLSEGREQLQSWRIEDYVSDVIAVLRHWETLRILVGHSMGGLVAQLAAPEVQLDRLVLVASSPSEGMLRNGFRMAIAHPWTFTVAGIRRSFKRLYKTPRVTRSLLFHPNTRQEMVDRYVGACQEESWIAGNQMITRLPDPRRIACSVTVIAGERDVMVDRRASAQTARDHRTSLLIFDKCAHMVPTEANSVELAEAIVRDPSS